MLKIRQIDQKKAAKEDKIKTKWLYYTKQLNSNSYKSFREYGKKKAFQKVEKRNNSS